MTDKLSLFPLTAEVSDRGILVIGGCDAVGLATEFGTPLYVFDDFTLRHKCREFVTEFGRRYAGTSVVYAGKAFLNRLMARVLAEEGLGLDVVSAGEMAIAQSVGFPFNRVYFHGNNKAANEVKLALTWQVGRIVVDNLPELKLVGDLSRERVAKPDILLRLTPGIDPHTHHYIATGVIDSKFGFSLSRAEEAVALAMSMPEVNLVGLHFHLGSLIHEVEPYLEGIEAALNFAAEMNQKHAFQLSELDIGGGFAVQYTLDSPVPPVSTYAEAIAVRITDKCRELGMPLPHLVIEPGRAIAGQAGVALYTTGVIKDIPGVRCYVSVDGGMADNIRPALYGSQYEAVIANKMREQETDTVTIAGRFCESGDILVRDIALPPITAGDVIAIPDCGAYCLPMASNYNGSLKPAIVVVREGEARLIRRRETFDDLTRCDLA